MPNHFQIVGLCARDWKRLEESGKEDYDFDSLESANLCELVCPMPKEFDGIVSMQHPSRYRHKTTGKFWLEDCNGPMGPDRGEWELVPLTTGEINELQSKFGASTWYTWQNENWGIKWGTYELKVHELGGDGSPVLIEFQTAWGAPFPEIMRKIDDYICQTYFLKNITWIGHDPGCGETCNIEVADAKEIA